ncbi:MAG: phosphate ABC transporter permease subunit PstC, partial [Acidimicrobiales bacterium]
ARRRVASDALYRSALIFGALIFVAVLVAFVVDLIIQARPAFAHFGFAFIWGRQWNPVTVHYGALPFIIGTLETTAIALVLAILFGMGAAIALAYLLPGWLRVTLGSAVELLAAIPSVIYGLWGLLVVAPWARTIIEPAVATIFGHSGPGSGPEIGVGLLLAGLVLFVMVLPTMVAISRDVLAAVSVEQREGAIALGATRWQVISRVVVPSARAGLLGAVSLSMGRALGETIAVTMVIGNTPQIPHSLFAGASTMASVIANQFTEATEPFHLSALVAVGVLLLVISVLVNSLARLLVRSIGRSRSGIAVA